MTEPLHAPRFKELEGLRGLAAISVVVFHFLVLFYPLMFYGTAPLQHMRFEDNIHGSIFSGLISGSFAVAIFFVLSGFVLSIGFFQTKKDSIIKRLAIKRYPRLMLPALASVLIAWLLIVLGLSFNGQAHTITMSSALNLTWSSQTSFLNAIYEGTVGIFTQGSVFNFNSVLWTMQYEFLGSFIVFALALIFGRSKMRWLIYTGLIVALWSTWFLGFILGMALADTVANNKRVINIRSFYYWLLLIIGIILGGYPWAVNKGTIYELLQLPIFNYDQNRSFYITIGAVLVLVSVLKINIVKKMMASKVLTRIGKHTYSLYLVHQPIIYTLGLGVFVFFIGKSTSYNAAVTLAGIIVIPIIIIATLLFRRLVEEPSLSLADRFEVGYSANNNLTIIERIRARILTLLAKHKN